MAASAVYEQATGLLTIIDAPLRPRFLGYAGRGVGRNNPALQNVKSTGPLPRGFYRVSLPFHHDTKGPYVFRLTPDPDNVMHNRSGFLIHGDNAAGNASHGCIVLPRHAREALHRFGVRQLRVVSLADPKLQTKAPLAA